MNNIKNLVSIPQNCHDCKYFQKEIVFSTFEDGTDVSDVICDYLKRAVPENGIYIDCPVYRYDFQERLRVL